MSPDSFIAKYTAKIKTPLKGSNSNKVGSGLPISNKYLITSKHVLEDCGTISVVGIKISFPSLDGESQFSIKNYYAFENSEIAFIELEEELPFEECPLFLCEKFTPNLKIQNWVSAGFPEYSSDFEQEMETIKGDLILLPEDQSKIQLSFNLSPKQAEKWSGVSGASVIVGSLILGTIDAVYTEMERKAKFNSLPYLFSSEKKFKV